MAPGGGGGVGSLPPPMEPSAPCPYQVPIPSRFAAAMFMPLVLLSGQGMGLGDAGDPDAMPEGRPATPLRIRQKQANPSEEIDGADEMADVMEMNEEATIRREFLRAAAQLSEGEIREFVNEHVACELNAIQRLPSEQRAGAFRLLCADWHPDKCPAIAGIALDIFQQLQEQKSKILHD